MNWSILLYITIAVLTFIGCIVFYAAFEPEDSSDADLLKVLSTLGAIIWPVAFLLMSLYGLMRVINALFMSARKHYKAKQEQQKLSMEKLEEALRKKHLTKAEAGRYREHGSD